MKLPAIKNRQEISDMKINKTNIEACAQAMTSEEYARLVAHGMDTDLTAHHEMVRNFLRAKGNDKVSLLTEFTELLEKKNAAWNPREAFEHGERARDREYSEAYADYIHRVALDPEMQAMDVRLQKLFDEIQETLGKENAGLITHYLEYHRTCYGIIPYNIGRFFNAGYCGGGAVT